MEQITRNLEVNKTRITQLLLLDLEKAFDSVWHSTQHDSILEALEFPLTHLRKRKCHLCLIAESHKRNQVHSSTPWSTPRLLYKLKTKNQSQVKTQAIAFTKRFKPTSQISVAGHNIPWSAIVKYLGVLLYAKVTWAPATTRRIQPSPHSEDYTCYFAETAISKQISK